MPAHGSPNWRRATAVPDLVGGRADSMEDGAALNEPMGVVDHVGAAVVIQTRCLLQEIAELVPRLLPSGITMRTEVPAKLWAVLGDPGEIHRALITVLLNARAAIAGTGQLFFSARNTTVHEVSAVVGAAAPPGDYVKVAIGNTGSDIYASLLSEGRGLRLAYVERVLRNHHGFARIDALPGGLTTVSLYFPRVGTPSRVAIGPLAGTATRAADGVLIVDHDETSLDLGRRVLTQTGYAVLVARDGCEALASFVRHRFDIGLVVIDLALSGVNCFTLIWALRRSRPGLRLLVALRQEVEENRHELERLGVREVVLKPFNSQQLLAAVNRTRAKPVQCEPDLFVCTRSAQRG